MFKCATWNIRSVIYKKAELEVFLALNELDALSISETWLTPKIKDWGINGYYTYRCDRKGETRGGGTVLLIKNSLG